MRCLLRRPKTAVSPPYCWDQRRQTEELEPETASYPTVRRQDVDYPEFGFNMSVSPSLLTCCPFIHPAPVVPKVTVSLLKSSQCFPFPYSLVLVEPHPPIIELSKPHSQKIHGPCPTRGRCRPSLKTRSFAPLTVVGSAMKGLNLSGETLAL